MSAISPYDGVPAWAAAAARRRLDLHLKAASPTLGDREEAFAQMSALLAEAIEAVGAAHAFHRTNVTPETPAAK